MRDHTHAIPIDVVDGRLWFQGARVDPEKHQRTALLVVENLEGQSTQVVLVPAAAGRQMRNWLSSRNRTTIKGHLQQHLNCW